MDSTFIYQIMVYVHLLLFVLWLGADMGAFLLGQHFRKHEKWSLEQRAALLTLLFEVDMIPRTAWALMMPVSLSVVDLGGWGDVPLPALIGAWVIAGFWLFLVWDAHWHEQTPRAARNQKIEGFLRYGLAAFYIWLGVQSLLIGAPLAQSWLAWKAILFGVIFLVAIMIDRTFKPVGPQLGAMFAQGSSDATELPLRQTLDRARIWICMIYVLLLITGFLGNVKPLF